ncbi:MAG: Hsp70 family protein, partial [Spirochaetaceae bacterium]|nr:Hsp70 family protein [Spirochaetaceae bacterium]
HVLQGEREMSTQNRTLGRFDLIGIPPAPRGVPQIEVAFDIDANGIVHVSAKDLGTGKEQKIRIESSSGLSDAEIDKMVKEAESHAEEDKTAREAAESRNEADNLIYATEKSLSDFSEKITEEDRQNIRNAISELKTAMESNDSAAIKEKTEALKQASFKLAEEVYKSTQAEGGTADQTGPESDGAAADADAGAGADDSEQPEADARSAEKEAAEDVDYEVVDEDEKS